MRTMSDSAPMDKLTVSKMSEILSTPTSKADADSNTINLLSLAQKSYKWYEVFHGCFCPPEKNAMIP